MGQAGEELFHKHRPELQRTDGRRHDFICPDGTTLELKCDSYDMNKTSNFFIEVWSNYESGRPGGPLQAQNNGTTKWVYMFPKNMTYFEFNTNALVAWLETDGAAYDLIEIKNPRYTTMGIKAPRAVLAHLFKEVKIETHE